MAEGEEKKRVKVCGTAALDSVPPATQLQLQIKQNQVKAGAAP